MSVTLTVWGGAAEIGGNQILLRSGEASLLLDFGISFDRRQRYFAEFLAPRGSHGLHDYIHTGLLPGMANLYRTDLVPEMHRSSLAPLVGEPGLDPAPVGGVLVTHAHLDHCAGLSFLRPDIPVHATTATAVVAKAIQDTGRTGLENELAYIIPREGKETLVTATHYRRAAARSRPYRILAPQVPEDARTFWATPGMSRGLEGDAPTPAAAAVGGPGSGTGLDSGGGGSSPGPGGSSGSGPGPGGSLAFEAGSLAARCWPVDHSIPGACAFAVETEAGWVVYTGDLRVHGLHGELTWRFAEGVAQLKPLALIAEGTHCDVNWPSTEAAVFEDALRAVRWARGLVVADFGPRHLERLQTFLEVARRTGRSLVITSRDAYLLEALAAVTGEAPRPLREPSLLVYGEAHLQRPSWERVLLERCGSRVVTAREVAKDPGGFILAFGYYDLPELLDIQPQHLTYIFSHTEAFDEESLIDRQRLRTWLDHFQAELVGSLGVDAAGRRRVDGHSLHVSGHIHGPALQRLVDTVKPQLLIPVHTRNQRFFRSLVRGRDTRLLLPEPGRPLSLEQHRR